MSPKDRTLAKELRDRGVRKRTAVVLARAANGDCDAAEARRALDDLALALETINNRLGGAAGGMRRWTGRLSDPMRRLRSHRWTGELTAHIAHLPAPRLGARRNLERIGRRGRAVPARARRRRSRMWRWLGDRTAAT